MEKIMQTIRVTQERIETEDNSFRFNGSKRAGEYLQKKIGNLASEVVVVLALNIKNEVIGYYEVFNDHINFYVANAPRIEGPRSSYGYCIYLSELFYSQTFGQNIDTSVDISVMMSMTDRASPFSNFKSFLAVFMSTL